MLKKPSIEPKIRNSFEKMLLKGLTTEYKKTIMNKHAIRNLLIISNSF